MDANAELTAAVERMVELLAEIAATLERLEAQGERQIELLLRSLDRSQHS